MRSTGVQLDLDQGRGNEFHECPPLGERFANAAGRDATRGTRMEGKCLHASAVDGIAANREGDFAAGSFEATFNQREISFFYLSHTK